MPCRCGSFGADSWPPASPSSQFGPPLDVHRLAGELRVRARDRVEVAERRVDERLVVVGERLVVVVDRRQVGVGEDRQQLLDPAAGLQPQPALAVELPAAVPARLVGPLARVALARARSRRC